MANENQFATKDGAVLEPSTNTHKFKGEVVNVEEVKEAPTGTLKMKVNGEGLVSHGEHGTVKTESNYLVKYNQQEFNPLRKKYQAVFD